MAQGNSCEGKTIVPERSQDHVTDFLEKAVTLKVKFWGERKGFHLNHKNPHSAGELVNFTLEFYCMSGTQGTQKRMRGAELFRELGDEGRDGGERRPRRTCPNLPLSESLRGLL